MVFTFLRHVVKLVCLGRQLLHPHSSFKKKPHCYMCTSGVIFTTTHHQPITLIICGVLWFCNTGDQWTLLFCVCCRGICVSCIFRNSFKTFRSISWCLNSTCPHLLCKQIRGKQYSGGILKETHRGGHTSIQGFKGCFFFEKYIYCFIYIWIISNYSWADMSDYRKTG